MAFIREEAQDVVMMVKSIGVAIYIDASWIEWIAAGTSPMKNQKNWLTAR
jgi:hypothetical protein